MPEESGRPKRAGVLAQFARLVTAPTIAFQADNSDDRSRPLKYITIAAVIAPARPTRASRSGSLYETAVKR